MRIPEIELTSRFPPLVQTSTNEPASSPSTTNSPCSSTPRDGTLSLPNASLSRSPRGSGAGVRPFVPLADRPKPRAHRVASSSRSFQPFWTPSAASEATPSLSRRPVNEVRSSFCLYSASSCPRRATSEGPGTQASVSPSVAVVFKSSPSTPPLPGLPSPGTTRSSTVSRTASSSSSATLSRSPNPSLALKPLRRRQNPLTASTSSSSPLPGAVSPTSPSELPPPPPSRILSTRPPPPPLPLPTPFPPSSPYTGRSCSSSLEESRTTWRITFRGTRIWRR